MILKIQKLNEDIVKEAQDFFGASFCSDLMKEKSGTYNESLVARYIIKKESQRTKALYGKAELFASISHKKNLVFVGVSKEKIGVDIEIIKKRDESLFENFREDEYEILGGNNIQRAKDPCGKSWENFYILWTAKESIIKFENLKLDDMENIVLKKVSTEGFSPLYQKNFFLNEINFNKELIFKFKGKEFKVFNGKKQNLVYSVCS